MPEVTERMVRVQATVKIEVFGDAGGFAGTTRNTEVSFHETLASSEQIRAAFDRLADIAVRGGVS